MSSENETRIAALRQALALAADNHALRLMLAELLQADGQLLAAVMEYDTLLQANSLDKGKLVSVGLLALQVDNLDVAERCLQTAVRLGQIEGVASLRTEIEARRAAQGFFRIAQPVGDAAPTMNNLDTLMDTAVIHFADVGGLEDVKKVIHKLIILPLLRPEVYQKYGRRSGGGVLMYGPPGCGKTMLARATAGECQLPFVNIRIEDILDPYLGVSERNLHAAFEYGRANAPCVLFIDELDALAFARRKYTGSTGRALVDQILQELDAIGAENDNVLILAATNAPWDIDDALMRPGRFDRRIFVPPPDQPARQRILEIMVQDIPINRLDLKQLAVNTPLFSGADLRALVDAAIDQVIDEALLTETEPPLAMNHLQSALTTLRPTTLEWLDRAQNYVEFANQDKRYEEVEKFLRSKEYRKWRS